MELQIRPYGYVLVIYAGNVPQTSAEASLSVTYRTFWGHAPGVTLGSTQDVIFQRSKDVNRGRPQNVSRGRPLELHRGPYGDVYRTSFGDVLRT